MPDPAPKKLIFYDLVPRPGGPLFSPNTWKTRLALLHKRVEFETRELSLTELRGEMKERTGWERPLVPIIETPEGEFISDSLAISEYLETHYPTSGPSLFLPSTPSPSPDALASARNFARLFDAGFGSSDAQWSTWFELAAPGLAELFEGEEKEYFVSDAKLGEKDGWRKIVELPRAPLLARARASLLPLRSLLTSSSFLASPTHPGMIDYIAFGRFAMCVSAEGGLDRARREGEAARVWVEEVGGWVDRMLELGGGEVKELLGRQ